MICECMIFLCRVAFVCRTSTLSCQVGAPNLNRMHAWTMTALACSYEHAHQSMSIKSERKIVYELKFSKLDAVLTMLSTYCRGGITAELKGKRTTVRPRAC